MNVVRILAVIVCLSLCLNAYLLYHIQSNRKQTLTSSNDVGTVDTNEPEIPSHLSIDTTHPTLTHEHNGSNDHSVKSETSSTERQNQFIELQNLFDTQQFNLLEIEIQEYLREYPNDIDAILLEAKVLFHIRPLNEALIHYRSLLSEPIDSVTMNEINELISVNTTRIIQQFTGDGAWDLLAIFLEPLVQIDPLNQQYLLALARAYGMQNQVTLMESTLASLGENDARAQRLREEINQRLAVSNQTSSLEQANINNENQSNDVIKQPDLVVIQSNGHYQLNISANGVSANMLLDTGASTTAISLDKFRQIDSAYTQLLGRFSVNTAGGMIQAPIYKIAQIEIGANTLSNVSIMVLPSDNLSAYDGLLGMNVLSQYDLEVNASAGTLNMFKK